MHLPQPIPTDEDIPQNADGTEILSASITANTVTVPIRVRVRYEIDCGTLVAIGYKDDVGLL